MSFTISIISVRGSENEGRELTINQTQNQNFTIVGRLYEIDSDSKSGVVVAEKVLESNAGGRTTIVMNSQIAADLSAAAKALYPSEQTPFYMLTFNVKALKNSINSAQGYNMTLEAMELLKVEASPIEPSMLDAVYNNAPNADAAMRSAEAYYAGVERRALQSQIAEAGKSATKSAPKTKQGRKNTNPVEVEA